MTEPLVLRNDRGSISVTAAALSRLVVHAAESADGARVRHPRRGVEVEHGDGRASVTLQFTAPYGAALPELARGVQARVGEALAAMCGLELESVDVTVEELED
ncbi:MAG: Asp23/Gls24 family envelope stress response protein [Actinomycetota bacterium]|nr:Asp23/Gls24 family envelope stress response protein [Actinomycetota bacterium]